MDMKIGMAMHIMFNSVKKAWKDFNGSHVIFLLEGRSWRKDFYPPYKANRQTLRDKRTPKEQEDDEVFFEAFNSLFEYLENKTNCTVLQQSNAEADDLIATWIHTHPNDQHIIISSDSDFYQLMAPNVKQYNGVAEQIISLDGFVDAKKGTMIIDKKTKKPMQLPDPKWLLFEKCVRGDKSDNVFSAYPGARLKGTKTKTGIQEAFNDIENGGYNYNNFMLQRWVDHNNVEHRVRDDFDRNMSLIDLTRQPDDIKEESQRVISAAKSKAPVAQVGIHFLKFCGVWDLQKISQTPHYYTEFLNAGIV